MDDVSQKGTPFVLALNCLICIDSQSCSYRLKCTAIHHTNEQSLFKKNRSYPESRIFDFWMPLFMFQNIDISTFLFTTFLEILIFGQPRLFYFFSFFFIFSISSSSVWADIGRLLTKAKVFFRPGPQYDWQPISNFASESISFKRGIRVFKLTPWQSLQTRNSFAIFDIPFCKFNKFVKISHIWWEVSFDKSYSVKGG